MRFHLKLRDCQPGEIFTNVPMEAPLETAHLILEAIRPLLVLDAKQAWMLNVELNLSMDCVVPKPEIKENDTPLFKDDK